MTDKLVVIINSLKVPKIKNILLYEMKFFVPNYCCLQNPWLGRCRPPPPDPRSLCLSSTEFGEHPPPQTKFLCAPLSSMQSPFAILHCHQWTLWLCYIFFTLSHKRHYFRKIVIEAEMSVLTFPTTFVWNISHSEKNWARYCHKCSWIFR